MRCLFMGTPEFALPSLTALYAAAEIEICGVFTQPDRKNRRGNKVAFSPIKEFAIAHQIPLWQPETLRSAVLLEEIKNLHPDVGIVVAYGQLLPSEWLSLPKYGCLNVHASLLPKYRGAAPLQHAILNGDAETGITIMRLDEGMDTGDILTQRHLLIDDSADIRELMTTLSQLGAKALLNVLRDLPAALTQARRQEEASATYAPKIAKTAGQINWEDSSRVLVRRVNALHTNPGTYTFFRGKRLKLHRITVGNEGEHMLPGTLRHRFGRLEAATGDGWVELIDVQPEGKRMMTAADFYNGNQVRDGERFENKSGE